VDTTQHKVRAESENLKDFPKEQCKGWEGDPIEECRQDPEDNDPPFWAILFDHTQQGHLEGERGSFIAK
jgi:hypothetical protein